jgi:NitT/TauT family transport system permease protein
VGDDQRRPDRARPPRGPGLSGPTAARSARPGTRSALRAILPAVAPLALIAIWWLTSTVVGSFLLPPPGAVLGRILEIGGSTLAGHAVASVGRVVLALGAATLTAVPAGIALGRGGWVSRLATPLVYMLYPVPKIALLPLVFLLVGVGEGARVFVLWLVLFFQVLVAVRDSVAAIPSGYTRSLTLLGGRRRDHLRFVVVPAILPALLTALRIGSATAMAVLFFAETFFTDRGLGFFIVDSWMKAAYVDMLAGIVTISVVGFGIFAVLDGLQRRLCRWKQFEG